MTLHLAEVTVPQACTPTKSLRRARARRAAGALSMVPPDVADDIVAEAFARVLAAIRSGGGPSQTFRGYLLAAVGNVANDWLRARRRLTVVDDMDVAAWDPAAGYGRINPGLGSAAETQVEARDEARLVTRAFGRLPARWREVLWQLEVEGKAPAAVAPMFGLSANGVSALAMRAGGAPAGLPRGTCRCEYPAGVPHVCGRVRRRGAWPAEPAPPRGHERAPRALPGLPGRVRSVTRRRA